jgi:DNA-binding beta-propeller fold protein YncE
MGGLSALSVVYQQRLRHIVVCHAMPFERFSCSGSRVDQIWSSQLMAWTSVPAAEARHHMLAIASRLCAKAMVRRRRLGALLMGCIFLSLPPAADALPQTVSVRTFADPPVIDASSTTSIRYAFAYRVRAEVRGAAACDSWDIQINGPGGGHFTRAGGAAQEIAVTATVGDQSAKITADVSCVVLGVSASATSEPVWVDRPPEPTVQPVLPIASPGLLPDARGDLDAVARVSTELALLTCPIRHSKARARGRALLRALCTTASLSAFTAAGTERFNFRPSDHAAPLPPSLTVAMPKRREICARLRGGKCRAARRTVATLLTNERAVAETLDALDRSIVEARDRPGSADVQAKAAAVALYSDHAATLLTADAHSRAALASKLRAMRGDVAIGRSALRRARRVFVRLTRLPSALTPLGIGPQTRKLASALLDRVPKSTRSLRLTRVLREALPTKGLTSQAQQVDWPMLTEVVRELAGDNGAWPALEDFRTHLTRRSQICDLALRHHELQLSVGALTAYAGPGAWLLRWLLAHVAAPADVSPPTGCPPPPTPGSGAPFAAFGTFGTGPAQFDSPTAVAAGPAGVYVADLANSRIERFTPEGQFLGAWGDRPPGDAPLADGQFWDPAGVALDPDGNVYVTDFHGERVQKFTSGGQLLAKWGGSGHGDGQFNRASGIAVAPNGLVYVVDPGNQRVQVFDRGGGFRFTFPAAGAPAGAHFSTGARGIAIDQTGNVYVADRNAGQVKIFASDGTFIRAWGQRGLDPGSFNALYDIAIDRQGNLWIADRDNYWIQHFTPTGQYLGLVDKWGPDAEPFNPWAISIDADGRLYVADINGGTGDRILIFGGLT